MKKIVVGIVVILTIILTLFLANILSVIDIFQSDGKVSTVDTYDVERTPIYKSVKAYGDAFMKTTTETMNEKKQEIITQNTHEVTETVMKINPVTGLEEAVLQTKEVCDVTVTVTTNEFEYAALLAYLINTDGIDIKTGSIDTGKADAFIKQIMEIKTTQSEKVYEIENYFESEDTLKTKYFNTELMQSKFDTQYKVFKTFFNSDTATVDGAGEEMDGGAASYDGNSLSIPLYLQYSQPWAAVSYGNGTIKNNGCAPTCLAMLMSYFKHTQILPSDIVAFTGNSYYVNGLGSSWGIFSAVASHYGVNCTNIGKNSGTLVSTLSAGHPVIASMGPGTFTKGGHFIILTGITSDGKITVNDPNDSAKKNHIGTQFELSLILREAKNFWSFG